MKTIKRWINRLWILNAFNGWFAGGNFSPDSSNFNNGLKMITGLR
jgi:hypothetical protein